MSDGSRLTGTALAEALAARPLWEQRPDGVGLRRHFCFDSYHETIEFVLKLARVAHRLGHYPLLHVGKTCLEVEILTPGVEGVTERDITLAEHVDTLFFVHGAARGLPPPSVEPDRPPCGCRGGCQ